jgi:hypothetical protein
MTVYDIALGVFIAFVVRDIVNIIATFIAQYIENKKADRELEEFFENLEQIKAAKSKKKAVAKKK